MRADFETIVVSRHDDHILLVTLDRPNASNALNTRMGLELMEVFEQLAIDLEDLRVAIITGRGDKAFCAGGDLKERNGMIAGRKVELITQDTAGSPALAKTKTQERA